MKIKKIYIKNFQSHIDTQINFNENFICITGDGNSGKSSIVRAISFFIFGRPWNKNFVQKGKENVIIIFELSNGIKIIREKGNICNKYTLEYPNSKDNIEFSNFGSNVPKEILDILNIQEINIDNKNFLNLNISNQYDNLFLINDFTSSLRNKVLNKLTNIHYIDYSLFDVNKDIKNLTSEKKYIITEIDSKKQELDEIKKYDKYKIHLDQLKEILDKLKNLLDKKYIIEEIKVKFDNLKNNIYNFKNICNNLNLFNVNIYNKFIELSDIYFKFLYLKSKKDNLNNYIRNIDIEIDFNITEKNKIQSEYNSFLSKLNICPFCNQNIKEKLYI